MGATRDLAAYIVSARPESIPADVRHEAHRALLNYVGCAVGGAREPAVDIAMRALAPYSGAPIARVLGRAERFDPLHASLMNGISSHVYDYDDTTPKNYIHPSSPVASALFAYASTKPVDRRRLRARVRARLRSRDRASATPSIPRTTTSAGTSPARPACSAPRPRSASCSACRSRTWSGRSVSPRRRPPACARCSARWGRRSIPGRSAQNGYVAALLAREGFTSGEHGIEGPRGFAPVQSRAYDLSKSHRSHLGSALRSAREHLQAVPVRHRQPPDHRRLHPDLHDELIRSSRTTSRPCACASRRWCSICATSRTSARAWRASSRCTMPPPIGLVRGKAGLQEFTDETVNDPEVKAVRASVDATADPSITEDAVRVEVELTQRRAHRADRWIMPSAISAGR